MTHGPADLFFVLLHGAVIAFNLSGWAWRATRRANLMLLIATGLSWLLLGIFYGLGYCPLTDWHYQVLKSAGATDLPPSWIAYMVERLSGWRPPGLWTDVLTLMAYLAALTVSLRLNWRDVRARRTAP